MRWVLLLFRDYSRQWSSRVDVFVCEQWKCGWEKGNSCMAHVAGRKKNKASSAIKIFSQFHKTLHASSRAIKKYLLFELQQNLTYKGFIGLWLLPLAPVFRTQHNTIMRRPFESFLAMYMARGGRRKSHSIYIAMEEWIFILCLYSYRSSLSVLSRAVMLTRIFGFGPISRSRTIDQRSPMELAKSKPTMEMSIRCEFPVSFTIFPSPRRIAFRLSMAQNITENHASNID